LTRTKLRAEQKKCFDLLVSDLITLKPNTFRNGRQQRPEMVRYPSLPNDLRFCSRIKRKH
jgi:hypothetical protein